MDDVAKTKKDNLFDCVIYGHNVYAYDITTDPLGNVVTAHLYGSQIQMQHIQSVFRSSVESFAVHYSKNARVDMAHHAGQGNMSDVAQKEYHVSYETSYAHLDGNVFHMKIFHPRLHRWDIDEDNESHMMTFFLDRGNEKDNMTTFFKALTTRVSTPIIRPWMEEIFYNASINSDNQDRLCGITGGSFASKRRIYWMRGNSAAWNKVVSDLNPISWFGLEGI